MRYVDGTLLLVKEKNIKLTHQPSNSFDKDIKFTIKNFPDGNVYFLDIQIDKNHANIYYKPTHTTQYTHFHSQTPWPIKTAWVKALTIELQEYVVPMLHSTDKLKTSKNLCHGIHTLSKYITPYSKD